MANFFRSLGSHSVLVKTTWTEELHLALIRLTDSQWGLIVIHSQPHQDVMDHRDGGLWRKTLDGPWKMLDRPQGRTLPSTVAPATCAAEVPVASTSTSATTSTATAVASATTTTTAAEARHLCELRRNNLLSLAQNLDKVSGHLHVALGEVGEGGTLGTGTTSSTDSVNVVLDVVWHVVVDDEGDVLDICLIV